MEKIINKVEQAGLITLLPEDFYFSGSIVSFDIMQGVPEDGVFREKPFRTFLAQLNLEPYRNQIVSVICSHDILLPHWAPMLVIQHLSKVTEHVYYLPESEVRCLLSLKKIEMTDFSQYKGAKVLIRGCSDTDIPTVIYAELTKKLHPWAFSVMYGEACSAVPVFKQKY